MQRSTTTKRTYSVREVAESFGISRTEVGRLIDTGRLSAKVLDPSKPRSKRLIPAEDVEKFADSLVDA